MSLMSEARPSPLVLALAEAVRSAVQNTNLVVDHSLATGDPVLVPCACAVDIGDQRCACGLSLALPDRWMRAARARRAARRASARSPAGRAPSARPMTTTSCPPTRWRSQSSGAARWPRCASQRRGSARRG